MAIPFSNTHHRIPRGFGNLLEGLTREVLREQPKDIPDFAAKYFAELLKKREETGFDPAEWGAKFEDRFYNNHSFKEKQRHSEDLIKTKAATIIQAAYRGHLGRKKIKKLKAAQTLYIDVISDYPSASDAAFGKTKDNQEIDSDLSAGTTNLELDMSTAEKQADPDQKYDAGELEANTETETEHGFTVEEPEELETNSTQSDDGEIKITLEETELNTENLEIQEGSFDEEKKIYVVEVDSEESGRGGLSTPLHLQDDDNETTVSEAEEQGESGFMEGHRVTSEEEPIQ